jgi:hypothetical protein
LLPEKRCFHYRAYLKCTFSKSSQPIITIISNENNDKAGKSCLKNDCCRVFCGENVFSFVFLRIKKLNTAIFYSGGRLMKHSVQQILFLTTLMLGVSIGTSWAQDAGMSDVEIRNDRDPGEGSKTIPVEVEVRYIPRASGIVTAKDSVALITAEPVGLPSEKRSEKQAAKQKDDSILTFNFLYYIIQKYKLQDIID